MKKVFSIVLCIFSFIFITGCSGEQISGDEWLLKQQDYMPDLQAFADGMDEVYTLYIIGSISPEDFAQEVSVLKQENLLMQKHYEQEQNNHLIAPENYSYIAQKGVQGIEAARNIFSKILNESIKEDNTIPSPEEISYMYLSYRQELNQHLADYTSAFQIISTQSKQGENKND